MHETELVVLQYVRLDLEKRHCVVKGVCIHFLFFCFSQYSYRGMLNTDRFVCLLCMFLHPS